MARNKYKMSEFRVGLARDFRLEAPKEFVERNPGRWHAEYRGRVDGRRIFAWRRVEGGGGSSWGRDSFLRLRDGKEISVIRLETKRSSVKGIPIHDYAFGYSEPLAVEELPGEIIMYMPETMKLPRDWLKSKQAPPRRRAPQQEPVEELSRAQQDAPEPAQAPQATPAAAALEELPQATPGPLPPEPSLGVGELVEMLNAHKDRRGSGLTLEVGPEGYLRATEIYGR